MNNKVFIDRAIERLNERVKEKLEKDGIIFEHEIYAIFKEETGLIHYDIPIVYDNIWENYTISQVSPRIFHDQIADDPDFRRAADKVKIMYNLVKAMHEAPTEVVYTSSPIMDESEMGPSNFHVKESDGDPFYNKYH